MGGKNLFIGLVVLALIATGGWYYMNKNSLTPTPVVPTPTPAPQTQSPAATESATTPAAKNMVTISSTGFEPKSIAIKVGDEVTWTNSDTVNHIVNSDPHPTHGKFLMLNVGMIKPGENKSTMFEKSGTYTYHDHLNPSFTGTVIVE